jgi:hypothetical protein
MPSAVGNGGNLDPANRRGAEPRRAAEKRYRAQIEALFAAQSNSETGA